jgi:hypothetical protein
MEVISRKDAHAKGLTRFFTGKPCKREHIRERNVATGACLGCLAHYAKEYAATYKAKRRAEVAGQVEVRMFVHPDHTAAIEAFSELLRHSLINGTPVPMVPRVDQVATVNTMLAMMAPTPVTPVAAAQDARYAVWLRIHGKEIADQMVASGS